MRLLLSAALAVALVAGFGHSAARAAEHAFLDQGWKPAERERYYFLAQGSEIMPYAWFLALEEPWGKRPFRGDANVEDMRFIPSPKCAANPDGLPVGFTKGKGKDGAEWFGLSCAACHTGQVTFRGKSLVVDGGTTLADMIGFQSRLVSALRATLNEEAKFDRFAKRVLGKNPAAGKTAALRERVGRQLTMMADWEATSRPAHPTGFGIWDAVNILLNQINGTAIAAPDNYRVPSTPVSYPSVWATDTYESLLWNASVHNSLLRQTGEVIIVFGKADITAGPKGLTFETSADVKALGEVYNHLKKLKPPAWPADVFGPINAAQAKRGKEIYLAQKCADCHPLRPYPQTEPNALGYRFVKTTATPIKEVGTDPSYAEYFVRRTAVPGRAAPAFKGTMFENQPVMPAAVLFLGLLTALTESELATYSPEEKVKLLGGRPLPTLPKTPAELNQLVASLLVYKATPLEGIWATAPYLHNGSVPTLYELLLPPEKRSKSFHLGNREFDPREVGYVTGPGKGLYKYDTTLPGFSNAGHDYGTKISDEDRRALLEFLKSL